MSAKMHETDLQQLAQTVAALAEALARSERRHAHLARTLRWGTLALVTLVGGAAAFLTNPSGLAFAQQAAFPQAANAVEALNNINRNLAVFGIWGEAMGQVLPAVEQTMQNNPDVQAQVQDYLKAHQINPTRENMMAYAGPAVIESAVTTLVDTVVLMQRIREDSNGLRGLLASPTPVLEGLQQELKLMNGALSAVPAMAIQMDFMNRNMASMTHSMGSTMGRMGSWLP